MGVKNLRIYDPIVAERVDELLEHDIIPQEQPLLDVHILTSGELTEEGYAKFLDDPDRSPEQQLLVAVVGEKPKLVKLQLEILQKEVERRGGLFYTDLDEAVDFINDFYWELHDKDLYYTEVKSEYPENVGWD